MITIDHLSSVEIFAQLTAEAREKLTAKLQTLRLKRGDVLVEKDEPGNVLYIVISGLFSVSVDGASPSGIEIGPGQPIGEIGFFSGASRSAKVTAKRDSAVLALDRSDFDEIARSIPEIKDIVIRVLSDRLVETTARLDPQLPFVPSRTFAVVQAGNEPIPYGFRERLIEALAARGSTRSVDLETVERELGNNASPDSIKASVWLDELGGETDFLIFWIGGGSTGWSNKLIQQSDELLLVASAGADPRPSEEERTAVAFHEQRRTRLVLLHQKASTNYPGTANWLANRRVAMHHHIAIEEPPDYARLIRFAEGLATGFVACGGGAFCAAHIGVYKAFFDRGVVFDMYGGTSGGGAMAAAFATRITPDELDARTHDIFIGQRALRHFTIPRYSLVDHTYFDRALKAHYRDYQIEDLAIPFFAISTELSSGSEHCHRTGPLWEAVRATGSIPGLLPPFFTEDGKVLVDGSLVDNVPLSTMRYLKSGPNIISRFDTTDDNLPHVPYDDLPGRWQIARNYCLPLGSKRLPPAPSLASVIVQAMMMSRRNSTEPGVDDREISVPLPSDMNNLDWSRHTELMMAAAAHANAEIDRALDMNDDVYSRILRG